MSMYNQYDYRFKLRVNIKSLYSKNDSNKNF